MLLRPQQSKQFNDLTLKDETYLDFEQVANLEIGKINKFYDATTHDYVVVSDVQKPNDDDEYIFVTNRIEEISPTSPKVGQPYSWWNVLTDPFISSPPKPSNNVPGKENRDS